jgi:hypothetical protein
MKVFPEVVAGDAPGLLAGGVLIMVAKIVIAAIKTTIPARTSLAYSPRGG